MHLSDSYSLTCHSPLPPPLIFRIGDLRMISCVKYGKQGTYRQDIEVKELTRRGHPCGWIAPLCGTFCASLSNTLAESAASRKIGTVDKRK